MKRIILSSLCLVLSAPLFSQDQHLIDSLMHELELYEAQKSDPLKIEIGDTTKIDLLFWLSVQYTNSDSEKAFALGKKSESIIWVLKSYWRLAGCYGSYGQFNFIKADLERAIFYFNKSLILYKFLQSRGDSDINFNEAIIGTLNNIAVMHSVAGNDAEALRYQFMSLNIIENTNDSLSLSYCYQRIGDIYSNMDNHTESLLFYKKALEVAQINNTNTEIQYAKARVGRGELNTGHDSIALTYFDDILSSPYEKKLFYIHSEVLQYAGEIYTKQGQLEEALRCYQLDLKRSVELGVGNTISYGLMNTGNVYFDLGNHTSAFQFMHAAVDTSRFYNFKQPLVLSLASLGKMYFKTGQKTRTLVYLTESLKVAHETNSLSLIRDAYKELVLVHSDLYNYKQAYENQVLYKQYKDSISNAEQLNKISEMRMQNEFDKTLQTQKNKQAELDLIQQAELSSQKQQKKIYIGSGFLLLLAALGLLNRLQYNRRTQKQLQEKNQLIEKEKLRAEQSERYKQQFLANMSHEIRTPMNAVMGMNNLILDKNPRQDQLHYLTGIKKSSETLLHIINDILDLSKIEAGKIELEKIDFSLQDVVGEVAEILRFKADEKGIELITITDPQIPVLIGDPVRLYQILMNLTGNAIKFTEKGSVQMIIEKGEETASSIIPIQFSIIDTGIGIPNDKLETVFENFKQANTSDSRKYGGTGLGLSISKQLIDLSGGTLDLKSEEGKGSTFSFTIPFESGSSDRLQQRTGLAEEIDGAILNGLSILIADDNTYNVIVATDTLKLKADVSIMTASDGQEVLALLDSHHFDVILMDVQMPHMNGYETTRHIREKLESPLNQIPVIALTASVIRSDLEKCAAAGMNDYVSKPFSTSNLILAIATATGKEISYKKRLADIAEIGKENTSTVTDLTYLNTFCEGNPKCVQKYIEIFLHSAPDLLNKVNLALGAMDTTEIASQIHGFKTKFIMMGMHQAKEMASQIEYQCRRETPDNLFIKTEVDKLLTLIETAITEVRQHPTHV